MAYNVSIVKVAYGLSGEIGGIAVKNKQELINYIAYQTNVRLENNPGNILNDKRKILHTTIRRNHRNAVLSLLNKKGIRYESHINDTYFIYI